MQAERLFQAGLRSGGKEESDFAVVAGRHFAGGVEIGMSPYVFQRRKEAYGEDAKDARQHPWHCGMQAERLFQAGLRSGGKEESDFVLRPRVIPPGGAVVAGRHFAGGVEIGMSPYVFQRRKERLFQAGLRSGGKEESDFVLRGAVYGRKNAPGSRSAMGVAARDPTRRRSRRRPSLCRRCRNRHESLRSVSFRQAYAPGERKSQISY
jgi:hypothetical protein